jgi:hypothetical protein
MKVIPNDERRQECCGDYPVLGLVPMLEALARDLLLEVNLGIAKEAHQKSGFASTSTAQPILDQHLDNFSDDHNTVKVRNHTKYPTADILPQRSTNLRDPLLVVAAV